VHWNSYTTTASADDTAAKAKQLGWSIALEPNDIPDVGRFAEILDPAGAVFVDKKQVKSNDLQNGNFQGQE